MAINRCPPITAQALPYVHPTAVHTACMFVHSCLLYIYLYMHIRAICVSYVRVYSSQSTCNAYCKAGTPPTAVLLCTSEVRRHNKATCTAVVSLDIMLISYQITAREIYKTAAVPPGTRYRYQVHVHEQQESLNQCAAVWCTYIPLCTYVLGIIHKKKSIVAREQQWKSSRWSGLCGPAPLRHIT